jgi:hypothetical protein
MLSLDIVSGELNVDPRLNGEALVIHLQLGNHVEKDATIQKRKENWSPTKILVNYVATKGQKVTIRGVQPKTITIVVEILVPSRYHMCLNLLANSNCNITHMSICANLAF